MNRLSPADRSAAELEIPTDLVAGLLMEKARTRGAPAEKLTFRVYSAMAATTLLTFATLMTGYQMLFAHHPFA